VDDRRGSFREVATGFSPEDTEHETARCLSCGCVRFDDCELRLLAEEYGVDMEKFKGYARRHKVDDRHPYVAYDPNKCILCSRCIRTCERVLPISALGLVNRGFSAEMRPAMNDPLARTNCVACGNCVDACPTAALSIKYPFPGRAALTTTDTNTHCAFCSLSCEQKVRKFGEQSYFIDSNDVPGDYLCRYGRFGVELFEQSTRITAPEVRRGSCRDVVDVPTAAAKMAQRLKQAADTHGPEKVGVFVSPELTTEEMYLAGRIARQGLGSSNVASLSIMATGQESGALDAPLGFTGSTEDRGCIANADLIVCNNTALESDHLILAVDVIEAVRNGAKLLVTNSTLDPADQFMGTLALDPMRGRSTWLYSGVTDLLIDSGTLSTDGVPGAEEFNQDRSFDLNTAAQMTGLDEEDFHEAAKLFQNASNVVFIHGMDRPQDQAPGDMAALADLLILLRNAGKQAEILLPRLIANSAGVDVAGADPVFAAGRDTEARNTKGATSRAELRKLLDDGEIKAALIIGEDPMGQGRTARWFGDVEFLGAMDWTPTETTSYADIVLPGTTYLENAGTRVNFEGEVVTYAQAVTPPAGVTGTQVLRALAKELGIDTQDCLTEELENKVKASLPDELLPFLWNTGQKRKLDEQRLRLVKVDVSGKRTAIMPPLVHSTRYRAEIRQVGTERYRVH
jgi:formate dehydrogenase major subunit